MTAREEVVAFGPAGSLIGIVTHPKDRHPDRPAILLISPSLVHRVGPFRLHVKLARYLADLGFLCLRFDFSGVGESLPRQDELPRNKSDIVETIQAVDFLATAFGTRSVITAGICRGAWVGLAAARQNRRISGLLMVDTETLVLSQQQSAIRADLASRGVFQSMRRPSSWRRLLQGRAEYRSRFAMLTSQLRARLRPEAQRKESEEAAVVLETLCARGARLLFLFSPQHRGYEYLQTVFQNRPLPPGMKIEVVPQEGYNFYTQASQRVLMQEAGRFGGQSQT